MPPLIAFAGALGGLAVVRWAYKTAMRINQELEESAAGARRRGRARRAISRRCGATPSPAPTGRANDARHPEACGESGRASAPMLSGCRRLR